MKKILVILLAFVMSFSLITHADMDTDIPDLTEDNIRELVLCGITEHFDTQDVTLKQVLTRGEFAEFIFRTFSSVTTGFSSDKVVFSDLSPEHPHFNHVMYMVSAGYMGGYGDGTFKPENEIKRNEVIKTLVSILGYDYLAKARGGYPMGYEIVAKTYNLLNGVCFDYEEYILKEEILKILINALDVPLAVIDGIDGEDYVYTSYNGRTIRTEFLKMYKGKGLVTANEFVAISGNKATGNELVVDGKLSLKISDLSQLNYIGLNVEFIYKKTEADINELVLMYTIEPNRILTVNRRDYVDYKTLSSANFLKYEDEKEIIKEIKILKSAVYIKNGERLPAPSANVFSSVSNGEFNLISTKDNGNFDVVIIRSMKNMLVGNVDVAKHNVFAKYESGISLNLDPQKKTVVIKDANGNLSDISQIKPMSVITYIEGAEYLEVFISDKVISGEVHIKDSEYWEVEGVKYYLSKSQSSNIKFNVKCWLNFMDEIVHSENLSVEDGTLVFMMKVHYDSVSFNKKFIGRFFNPATGKIEDYEFAEKVKLDEDYATDDYASIETALNTIIDGRGTVVKIWLNSDNKITTVDTPVSIYTLLGTENDGFCMSNKANFNLAMSSNTLGGVGYINDNTYMYAIPADVDNTDASEFISISVNNNYMRNGHAYENVRMYFNSKNNMYAEFIAFYDTPYVDNPYRFPGVFEKLTVGLNKSGEKVYKVYYTGSKEDSVEIKYDDTETLTALSALVPGDIVTLTTDKDGILRHYKIIYDSQADALTGKNDQFYATPRYDILKVYEITSDYIAFTNLNGDKSSYERYKSDAFKIIIVNQKKENNIVKSALIQYGTMADVNVGDNVFIYTSQGVAQCMVVYK